MILTTRLVFRLKGYNNCVNIYLDIDGVLLTKEKQPAKHLAAFLKYVTDNHTCYWLTTNCKETPKTAVDYVLRYTGTELVDYLHKILFTPWGTYKTEGIDFSKEFRWLDDHALVGERQKLQKHDRMDSLITVNLRENTDQLLDIVCSLK